MNFHTFNEKRGKSKKVRKKWVVKNWFGNSKGDTLSTIHLGKLLYRRIMKSGKKISIYIDLSKGYPGGGWIGCHPCYFQTGFFWNHHFFIKNL